MIPKKIHYIWIGNQSKSESIIKCIDSWKKYLPDYQFFEWGNDILKEIDNLYVTEALNSKKWAFVSDYIRLYVLKKYGGIYLDTDVVVTQPFTPFLSLDFFMGYEPYEKSVIPMTAVIGASKNNPIIKNLLHQYNHLNFIKKSGEYDLTPNTHRFSQYFQTKYELYFEENGDIITKIDKLSYIYPTNFFCKNTDSKLNYSIHLFNGSWIDGFSRRNKLSLLNYKLVRYKRINYNNDILPLSNNEKFIVKLKISKKYIYTITKIGSST